MALPDNAHQVLAALALRFNFESTTRLDVIMAHVRHTEMTWSDAEDALQHLQLLGYARSMTRGHWFITREGIAALAQQEAADG